MHNDRLRYQCQMNLPRFGPEGQQRLQEARVLVVGAGGLGCPAAQYLAAAGVGTLSLADFDTVSVGNLHRQVLYTLQDTGKKKALLAAARLQAQNPGIRVVAPDLRFYSLEGGLEAWRTQG